jgi:tRNA pseudouridine55 synthase
MENIGKLEAQDILDGQLMLIDKPLNWTSFDAVKKLRYLLRTKFGFKKLKVGHAGTLDPLATGLLLICTGKYTKQIQHLTLEDKTYTGTFILGATTPSFDLETEPENFTSVDHLTEEEIRQAAAEMVGEQAQIPPVFSAKWIDGKRAYESARKGVEVEMKSQQIEIKSFKVTAIKMPEIHFSITCSKGTYIRSIARDFGVNLKVGSYLSSLRREAVGSYNVANAIDPSTFEERLKA